MLKQLHLQNIWNFLSIHSTSNKNITFLEHILSLSNRSWIIFRYYLFTGYNNRTSFERKKICPYKSSFIPYCKNHLNVYVHMYIRIKIIWGKNKKIKIERTPLDIPFYKRVFSLKLKTFSRGPAASYVYMLSLVWTRYFHVIVVLLLNW